VALALAWVALLALGPVFAQAAFRGDNGKIVYVTHAGGGGQGTVLVARDAGGGGRRVLHKRTSQSCVGNPAYSPDGASLALDTCDHLATMRADGSGRHELPRFSQPEQPGGLYFAHDLEPAWSPDGERLVFVSRTGYDDGFESYESRRLVVMNADGSEPRELPGQDVHDPHWSSRGLIAFSSQPPRQGQPAIWAIRPDGSGLRRVIGRAGQPTWSPDGRRIAFTRPRLGDAPFRTIDTRICIAAANASASGPSPAASTRPGRRMATDSLSSRLACGVATPWRGRSTPFGSTEATARSSRAPAPTWRGSTGNR
jgi:Tol biopolymer transport system component